MSDIKKIPEYFGCNVFNDAAMREYLPKRVYQQLREAIDTGKELDPKIADFIAHGMKEWAIERGATHFTHWFQPLTGATAEKHDSFITAPGQEGQVMMEFSGKELVKGESDASSFPSGGLRATFEARGYTAWDCTSPAFLREDSLGVTLCIPTAFCSFGGEALDKKTPLLRSMQALNTQALRILRLFGNTTSERVVPYVGAEQEYFLIDLKNYKKRKDLVYTRRTLFGAPPAKGQELDDHYYGTIRERIGGFMHDVDRELWKLGVPAKTEHNEVAPAQHELAPIYEQVNVAADHNQITMEVMKRVAEKHGLACLLHEKPFAGVNGSGKHNNWSISTDDGINMLYPGETPHENLQFLLVLACIIKAVDDYPELLRMSAANVGNDLRLGGNEAPPAIISIFLGEQLEDVIDQLCETGSATHSKQGQTLATGVATLPDFEMDVTDRNRTSPFAFTGNKFEFRMVGASDSISSANIVLNTIVADCFREAADEIEASDDKPNAIHDVIKRFLREHRRILFNGNGYSEAWVKEAARRGLPNLKSMVDAIPFMGEEKTVRLFERFGVYTRAELESRVEICFETYAKAINIEANAMINISGKHLIPAVIRYNSILADSLTKVRDACPEADVSVQRDLLKECSALLTEARDARKRLAEVRAECAAIPVMADRARAYHDKVVPAMLALRNPIDRLEIIVDKDYWPMPSYGDMIFEV